MLPSISIVFNPPIIHSPAFSFCLRASPRYSALPPCELVGFALQAHGNTEPSLKPGFPSDIFTEFACQDDLTSAILSWISSGVIALWTDMPLNFGLQWYPSLCAGLSSFSLTMHVVCAHLQACRKPPPLIYLVLYFLLMPL